MSLKKIVISLLCLVLTLSLCCCAEKETYVEPEISSISIYYGYSDLCYKTEDKAVIDEIVAMFRDLDVKSTEKTLSYYSTYTVEFYEGENLAGIYYVDSDLVFSDTTTKCFELNEGAAFDYQKLNDLFDCITEASGTDTEPTAETEAVSAA